MRLLEVGQPKNIFVDEGPDIVFFSDTTIITNKNMTSIEFKERILLICLKFIQNDELGFNQKYDGDDGMMSKLDKFLKGDDSLRLLLKRGETDLSEHWKMVAGANNAAFSNLLEDDQIERLGVNSLIDAMRNLDTRTPHDFQTSTSEIMMIEDAIIDYIQDEAKHLLRKQLEKPFFYQNFKARMRNLEAKPAQHGLLTRVKNKDPTLNEIMVGKLTKESPTYVEKTSYRKSMLTLNLDRMENADDLIFMLSERAHYEDANRRFSLNKFTHETEKLVKKLEQHIEFSSDVKDARLAQAYFYLGFIGYGLNHTLKAANVMLELQEQCPNKGKRLNSNLKISYLLRSKQFIAQNKKIEKPDGLQKLMNDKVLPETIYTGGASLIGAFAGNDEDVMEMDDDYWQEHESQPTALELLYVLAYVLLVFASYHEDNDGNNNLPEQLFSCKWVLEQSVTSYQLLLALLARLRQMATKFAAAEEKEEGTKEAKEAITRDKGMTIYIFDCFAKILLNNLNALYESEQAYLDLVFEQKKNKRDFSASQFVQKEYYPKVLEHLVWRTTLTEEDKKGAIKFLTPWQKVLPMEDAQVYTPIYASLEDSVREEILMKQKFVCLRNWNFEKDLPQILEELNFQKTADNEQEFKKKLENVNEFLRAAIDQKSPIAGTIIQTAFKAVVEIEPDQFKATDSVSMQIANKLRAQLFLASNDQGSKLGNVARDLLEAGVKFKMNTFTVWLLRMMTADSVNMLKNVKEVDIESEVKKRHPWNAKKQTKDFASGGDGNDASVQFDKLERNFKGTTLPHIVEIGFYTTAHLLGIHVAYSDGTIFEAKGNSPDASTYQSLKLKKGEYIDQIKGRTGAWFDQLTVHTNLGRSLTAGGEGGSEKDNQLPQDCYLIGFKSWRFHHHLTKLELCYIDLNETGHNFNKDPIVTLITESELLSKGVEQSYMNVFSQAALDEIKTVQAMTSKQILDANIESSTASEAESSSATTMISTMAGGLSNSTAANEFHMQIIHCGQNETLDEFIQVLQLLLKESNEPLRMQLNIMQDKGLRATRACFAVIVKLAGLTPKLECIIDNLELRGIEFEGEGAERIKEMKNACKEMGQVNDVMLLLKEWCNATKMRHWLKETTSAAAEESDKILTDMVKKAEFLTKLEKPPHFQSLDPKQELFELSYKIPSYARDNTKDAEELAETQGIRGNDKQSSLWREHYTTWKTDLKTQGTIRTHQQKLSEIRKIGTAAILVCLQHKEIKSEALCKVVETNFLNSCYRMMGLQMLEFVMQLIATTHAEQPQKEAIAAVRNVAGALNFGIRSESEASSHYMDGIRSCGAHLESLIRKSFFNVVHGVAGYFTHADETELLNLLSCLDWSFKARDFDDLLSLKAFKLLHTGVNRKLESIDGQKVKQNIVLESWQLRPTDPLTKRLQIMSSNLFMSIVSRLAEPEARKIIFSGSETEKTGVSSLSRASSVVNVNAAQALLAEEFSIMFREFHEFIIIASKMARYIDFEMIQDYGNDRESEEYLYNALPEICSTVMTRIIKNAPYENFEAKQEVEESKGGDKLSNGAVIINTVGQAKKVMPTEKPWLKKNDAPKKKSGKVYDMTKWTQEQIEVLEALDNQQTLNNAQKAIHAEILAIEEDNDLAGMFDEPDECETDAANSFPQVQIFVKGPKLERDSQELPKLRQKMIQGYRKFKEEANIARYLNLVLIFVKIATKATYPLEMLQNVANPYFIRILLQMLFQVSAKLKLQILTIFQTLLRIQVPLSIFDEGVSELKAKFRTETKVQFDSTFAQFLFQAALQIQAGTWDSAFSEEKRGGMHDVSVHLARTVALCLKVKDLAQDNEKSSDELSHVCYQLGSQELTPEEIFTFMQVLQATCSMPVVGDTILPLDLKGKNADQTSAKQPETARMLLWSDRQEVFENSALHHKCLILPEFVPDSLIPLVLTPDALSSLVKRLCELAQTLGSLDFAQTLQAVYIIKLLILQHTYSKNSDGLSVLTSDIRHQLVHSLAVITHHQGEDEFLFSTSTVEYAVAAHLRDNVEHILSSGVDPFEEEKSDFSSIIDEEKKTISVKLRSRRSTVGKKGSATAKYAQQLLRDSIKKKKTNDAGARSKQQKQQVLLNNLFKDQFASIPELIEMNAMIVEFCTRSGCTLLEAYYGIHESLPSDKKYSTADQIFEFYNEWLEKLAENEDMEKDAEIEQQFLDHLTKKIDKILQIYKPLVFKSTVLSNVNLELACQEVEEKTDGLSKLMQTRVQDHICNNYTKHYKAFADQTNVNFDRDFKTDIKERTKSSDWPLTVKLSQLNSGVLNNENKMKSVKVLAKRFSEKLSFQLFDPSVDTVSVDSIKMEELDIADVMAGKAGGLSLATCYNSIFMIVRGGLSSYSKSVELLSSSAGVECSWETSYQPNFLTESKLSVDFDSLRQVDKQVISRDMLVTPSTASLANRAEQMLNEQLMREFQSTPEQQQRGERFLTYLLQRMIASTLDDFAFKLEQKPRLSSSLVNALNKSDPNYVSSYDLVERVKLISCAVMKHKSDGLKLKLIPDLFCVTMLAMLNEKTGLDQKRLLIDQAFQIVQFFDQESVQREAVESGSWAKIAESAIFRSMIEELVKMHPTHETLNILGLLILDLNCTIKRIGASAAQYEVAKPAVSKLDESAEIFQTVSLINSTLDTDIGSSLIDFCLAEHRDTFFKDFKIDVRPDGAENDKKTLDFGFVDGVRASFNLTMKKEIEGINPNQFTFWLQFEDATGSQIRKRLVFGEELKDIELKKQQMTLSCNYSSVKNNLAVLGEEVEAAIHLPQSCIVKDVLYSSSREYMYFITDMDIIEVHLSNYSASENAGKENSMCVLTLPEFIRNELDQLVLVSVERWGSSYFFVGKENDAKVILFNKDGVDENWKITRTMGGKKITKVAINTNVQVYITEDNKLHHQGLFDMMLKDSSPNGLGETQVYDMNAVGHFTALHKVVDVKVGGQGAKKYAVVTIDHQGQKQLYSVGYNGDSVLGRAQSQDESCDKLIPCSNQTRRSNWKNVWLFPTVSFALDYRNRLWVLGGRLSVQDDDIFPRDLYNEFFATPQLSKLHVGVKKALKLAENIQILVTDINYTERLFLITLQLTNAESNQAEEVTISLTGVLTDMGEALYEIKKLAKSDVFSFDNKPWTITEPQVEENKQDLGFELQVTGKVLEPNLKNISLSMIAQIDPSSKLVEDLAEVEKLRRDEDLINKVYMAMNTWIRNIHSDAEVQLDQVNRMITESKHEGELNELEKRNPIMKLWNDQVPQKHVQRLVHAIGQINLKYLNLQDKYKAIRDIAFKDPLLEDTLLRERLQQTTTVPSTCLAQKFITAIEFLFFQIQNTTFEQAEKPPKQEEERIQCSLHRFSAAQYVIDGKVDRGDGQTLFSQVFKQMQTQQPKLWADWWRKEGNDRSTGNRVLRANFQGESSIDAGGPYREVMDNISRELCSSVLPILVPSENQLHEHGELRECWVLNHDNGKTEAELDQIYKFGLIIGFAIRSKQAWNMELHPIIWKQIVGVPFDADHDLKTSDKFMHQHFGYMRQAALENQSDEELAQSIGDQCFTINFGQVEYELMPGGASKPVTRANLEEYIKMASLKLLHKADTQMKHFLSGVHHVVPKGALMMLSWQNAEIRAMGIPTVDIDLLRRNTTVGNNYGEAWMKMYWEVMEEMEEEDRRLYLKFVFSRSKLTSSFGRNHEVNQQHGGNDPDAKLPQAHTCFFQIDMPKYTTKEIMSKRLLTAIRFCGEIDTD